MWTWTCFRDVSWVSWHSQLSEWTLKTVRGFASGSKASFLPSLIVSTAVHDCSYSLSLTPISWVPPLLKRFIAFFKAASQNWCATASLGLPATYCVAKKQGEPGQSLCRAVKVRLGWNTHRIYSVKGTVFWKHQSGYGCVWGGKCIACQLLCRKSKVALPFLLKRRHEREYIHVAFLTSQLAYNPLESK